MECSAGSSGHPCASRSVCDHAGDMQPEEKKQRALAVADTLNLTKALNNYVGSAMIKGIR